MTMRITSSAFAHEGPIPKGYTCDGSDASPPLSWVGVPDGTASLALIVDDPDAPDPDAPKMTFVHWVLYNLPSDTEGLPENVADDLPSGTLQGMTDFGRPGWGGPCPPIGRHRYFFKLFALDTVLPDLGQPTSGALQEAMEGHVLAEAGLMGTYRR